MKINKLIAALLLAALALAARAGTPLINLVDENATIVVVGRDMPALLKTFNEGPWRKAWEDEQFKKFVAPLREKLKVDEWNEQMKAETGLTIEEAQALIQGDMLFALGDFSKIDFENAKPDDIPLLFAAEIGDNKARLEKLMNAGRKKDIESTETEEYAGVTVNTVTLKTKTAKDKPATYSWAVSDNVLLMSMAKQGVISAIDALKNGGAENAFGKSTRYLRMQERTKDAQVFYALNFRALYPFINKGLAQRAKSGTQDAAMINYTNLASTLGLDALGDIYFGVKYAEDHADAAGAVTYAEKRGLLKFFTFQEGSAELPDFASAAWPNVSVVNYNVPEAYAALEELLDSISPGVALMAQSQLQQFNQRAGIDFKRDLIGSIGGKIFSANVLAAGATSDDTDLMEKIGALYVIELKDARTFAGTLDTIKRFAGLENNPMLVTRDYLGSTINTFQSGGDARNQVSYAIAKNQLVFSTGSPTILEAAVQNITNGAADPLKNRADIRAALADAPASAVSVSVQDTAFIMRLACDMLAKLPQMGEYIDATAVPDTAFFKKYVDNGYSWTTAEADGLYFASKMYYKKDGK